MTTTLIKTENLILDHIRTPKGHENETGAQVVMEYKDQESGARVKVYAQKSQTGRNQWIDDGQDNLPDDEKGLLLSNSGIVQDWSENNIKYCKLKYLDKF